MGDIHGAYRALRQCLERSGFDHANDTLIFLGDVGDGWPETSSCIEELLKVQHLIFIMGNHDEMMLRWMMNADDMLEAWLYQGGIATIESYAGSPPQSHIQLIRGAQSYHVYDERVFTHAGFNPDVPLGQQDPGVFCWDRTLAQKVISALSTGDTKPLTSFTEVYIGHTPIPFDRPIDGGGVWMMDTGAGWAGCLSMMNVLTHEIYTSDKVPRLYPGVKGRGG